MIARPTQAPVPLADLYERDETAWLEAMADLLARGRIEELDTAHLQGYLTDMAIRDRREVRSRLTVLLGYLLKWDYQPDKRTGSWRATIKGQRRELRDIFESRTLRNHAAAVLSAAYEAARDEAATETGLDLSVFPDECPYSIDDVIASQ